MVEEEEPVLMDEEVVLGAVGAGQEKCWVQEQTLMLQWQPRLYCYSPMALA